MEEFDSCVEVFNCWLFIGYGTVFGIIATIATFGRLISRENQDYERIELLAEPSGSAHPVHPSLFELALSPHPPGGFQRV